MNDEWLFAFKIFLYECADIRNLRNDIPIRMGHRKANYVANDFPDQHKFVFKGKQFQDKTTK